MAITKTIENDKIEIVQKWNIQVRTATVIKEDGTELTRSFSRKVIVPGRLKGGTGSDKDDLVATDISGEDADVQGRTRTEKGCHEKGYHLHQVFLVLRLFYERNG